MAFKLAILSCTVCAHSANLPSFTDFATFANKYSRKYITGSKEFAERQKIYDLHIHAAEEQNRKPGRLWTAGPNEFWDWNDNELSALYGWSGAKPEHQRASVKKHGFLQKANKSNGTFSDNSVNWATQGGASGKGLETLSVPKNQGSCGSCWAVAAATTLEAVIEVKRSQRRSCSVQQLISCVPNPQHCGGQGGCKGATVELAFDWIMSHGCQQDHEVPYKAMETECSANNNVPAFHGASSFGMYDWETLPVNQYEPLVRALMDAPVAVSVAASGWVNYYNGIYDGCPNEAVIDHAVVSHGFGEENGVKYWHISNSWGQWWGEGGRMRLVRTDADEQQCGWNNKPEMGTGCNDGPERVWVCGQCGILYDSVVAYINN